MTINSPAPMIFAMYLVVAEKQGADWKTISGTIQNDILKEFIAQKEYIFPPRPSMRLITDIFAFCAARGAAVEHDLGERLSHPRSRDRRRCRSWRSRCATASSTCSTASTPGSTSTTSCRASRSSSTRTATSSRRSPSTARPASCGPRSMRDRFGAKRRAVVEAALPHPDRRRLADRAAALQQRRPDRAAGARRGARRHQLAAHQLARRGAGAADRGSRDAGAAHAADHRARKRRHQRRRSARRLVFRREADARHGSAARWSTSTPSIGMGGMVEAIERGLSRSRKSPRASYRFQQAVERREQDHRRRQRFRAGRRDADRDSLHRRQRPPSTPACAARRAAADAATTTRSAARSTRCATAARGTGQHDAAAARLRARLRDRRRDVRRAPRGVGRVRRSTADHEASGLALGAVD